MTGALCFSCAPCLPARQYYLRPPQLPFPFFLFSSLYLPPLRFVNFAQSLVFLIDTNSTMSDDWNPSKEKQELIDAILEWHNEHSERLPSYPFLLKRSTEVGDRCSMVRRLML